MHPFDVLGDPVRRRILELLAEGEHTSGAIVAVIQREFGISQWICDCATRRPAPRILGRVWAPARGRLLASAIPWLLGVASRRPCYRDLSWQAQALSGKYQ